MKDLIVYYSLEGNTEYAARKIAEITGAELLRLEPVKEYPTAGFRKFFWGGKSAVMWDTPELQPYTFRSEEYDCIIIGFPVWAGTITPPIRTFIREHALHAKKIAAFACESGSGGDKALEKLRSMIGIDEFSTEMILIDPKSKPNSENDEKIRMFCSQLVI